MLKANFRPGLREDFRIEIALVIAALAGGLMSTGLVATDILLTIGLITALEAVIAGVRRQQKMALACASLIVAFMSIALFVHWLHYANTLSRTSTASIKVSHCKVVNISLEPRPDKDGAIKYYNVKVTFKNDGGIQSTTPNIQHAMYFSPLLGQDLLQERRRAIENTPGRLEYFENNGQIFNPGDVKSNYISDAISPNQADDLSEKHMKLYVILTLKWKSEGATHNAILTERFCGIISDRKGGFELCNGPMQIQPSLSQP